MSLTKHVKNLAEPEFGRAIKIYVWEHGDMYSKCHEMFINPNHLRTFNAILNYLTDSLCPVFGAIRKLVSIKTKKCINCFKDLENNGRYIAVGIHKTIKFSRTRYRTCSEIEMQMTKKTIKRFYSGDIGDTELRFLCETEKRRLTIIYVLINGITCQSPFKVVLTGREILAWDFILSYLESILDIPTGIQHLCTIYGDVILDPSELQHGYVYVAVPYNQKFEDMYYMSFFSDWEKDPSKKKGFLSNIRPSSRKYGKDSICEDFKNRKVLLGDKESYTITCDCDPECLEEQDEAFSTTYLNNNTGECEIRKPPDFGAQSESDKKTICMDEDQAVIAGNEICIFVSIDGSGKFTQICPQVPTTKNVEQCMPLKIGHVEAIDRGSRATDTTQTNTLKPVCDKHVTKKNNKSLSLKDESDRNVDNTEYISISVIVSKTSKVMGKSKIQENGANVTLSKTCEARTYCPNIAVSGSFSKKVGVVTEIVNNVITETYGRLMQPETKRLKSGEDIDQGKKSIMNSGDSTNAQGQQDVQDNNLKEICKKCPFKLNAKDHKTSEGTSVPMGSKCIKIQNKTFINVCDVNEKRDQNEDTKRTYSDKGTSSLHIPTCPYAKQLPQSNEYKCCICPTAPIDTTPVTRKSIEEEKIGDPPTGTKNESKPNRSTKPPTVRIPKDENRTPVSKQRKNATETETQNVTRVSLEVQPDGAKNGRKPAQNSMSVDSLSEEVVRRASQQSKNQATRADGKDTVSITVNISKQNGPSKPSTEQKNSTEHKEINDKIILETEETDNGKGSDVYSSKIMLDGNLTERDEVVRGILNDIVCTTFEKLMPEVGDAKGDDKRQLVTNKSEDIRRDTPTNPKDTNGNVATDITDRKNVSSQTRQHRRDSKDRALKTSFDKIGENQNNVQITVVPPKRCSGSPKRMPITKVQELDLCENYKSKKGTSDNKTGLRNNVYCLCEPPKKQDIGCCACSKYATNVQAFRVETKDIECCICTKYRANIQPVEMANEKETAARRQIGPNQESINGKSKETKENTNRSFQNDKDFMKNGKPDETEGIKSKISRESENERKSEKLISVTSFTRSTSTGNVVDESRKSRKQGNLSSNRRSRGSDILKNELRKMERSSNNSTGQKSSEIANVSSQRKNKDIAEAQFSKSKSRTKENDGGFASDGGESEISVDSIDENACCICVCSPQYIVK